MANYSRRVSEMADTAAILRNLFSAMGDPQTISFGGGAPAKEALPVEKVREIFDDIMRRDRRGIEMLQYGSPEGLKDLREIITTDLLAPMGVKANGDQVMIFNGGLEPINMICQLFIDPGDVILVESPTFVQSVEIFQMFEARCIGCQMDDDGVIPEDVEEKIKKYSPKMLYVIPTFQNPSGRTLSLERRKAIAELGSKYDVMVVEDDPYREVRYSGEALPPIKAFDATGHTIFANSFSKIFSPGSRLGYVAASDDIIRHLFDIKTATNSHTGMISQVIAAEFFKRGYYPEHIKSICNLYRQRRDVMMDCLREHMPRGTKFTYPDGGLFTWVQMPGDVDTEELLKVAREEYKVAYVGGAGFFVEGNGMGKNCMRMSFGSVPPDTIREGMARMGRLMERVYGG